MVDVRVLIAVPTGFHFSGIVPARALSAVRKRRPDSNWLEKEELNKHSKSDTIIPGNM